MEQRRVKQAAALSWSVLLVVAFIFVFGGAAVFFSGSKSNSVFSPVTPAKSPPSSRPSVTDPPR